MKTLQEIFVPHESVNDETVLVVGLNYKNGDPVKKNDIVLELETSKAVVTVPAETDGYIIYYCQLDDEVGVGAIVARIYDIKPESIPAAPKINATAGNGESTSAGSSNAIKQDTRFSKKALELLQTNNLPGSIFAQYDFVTEETVLNYLQPGKPKKETGTKPGKETDTEKIPENVVFEKLPPGKKREIEYLSSLQRNGLVSTLYISVQARKAIRSLKNKLSYFKDSLLTLVVLESSRLLRKYPLLNAYYSNNQIGKYSVVNIGIAIDMDDGLKVVNLPDTDQLDIYGIEQMIFDLSNKYLDKKLELKDLSNVTFTITDISMTRTTFFTPLINKNNAAILGISGADDTSGNAIISLSFDHRVTEGKYAGNFLTELKTRIESFSFSNEPPGTVAVCYKCLKEIAEDLNDTGFIKVQTRDGEEKLICDTCLFKF